MRGDFRHLTFHDQRTLSNYEYTAGISYQFGGEPAVSKLAAAPTPPPEPAPAPPAVRQQPEEPVEAPLEPVPAAEPTPGMYKYCVTMNIQFDIDRAEIRPEFHGEVAKVGDFMKKHPTTTAIIEGHADEVGSDQYNLELSQKRAAAVVAYLLQEFGIEPGRVVAKGYGKTKPIADNSTDAGRQKNRRIEAVIDCAFDVKENKPPERLCIGLQLEFDTGSAEVKPGFGNEIQKVADFMKKYPTTTALIEGHTDNTGSADANQRLSQRRAESVVNFLVESFGIDRSRLSAKGYGASRRIAYNSTPEGRKKNRRINAVIDCVLKP